MRFRLEDLYLNQPTYTNCRLSHISLKADMTSQVPEIKPADLFLQPQHSFTFPSRWLSSVDVKTESCLEAAVSWKRSHVLNIWLKKNKLFPKAVYLNVQPESVKTPRWFILVLIPQGNDAIVLLTVLFIICLAVREARRS